MSEDKLIKDIESGKGLPPFEPSQSNSSGTKEVKRKTPGIKIKTYNKTDDLKVIRIHDTNE